MPKLRLLIKEISDLYTRENFQRIVNLFDSERLTAADWKPFQVSTEIAVVAQPFKHNLPFTPNATLQASITGAGTLTWLYDQFDKDFIYFTATGPIVFRGYLGFLKL